MCFAEYVRVYISQQVDKQINRHSYFQKRTLKTETRKSSPFPPANRLAHPRHQSAITSRRDTWKIFFFLLRYFVQINSLYLKKMYLLYRLTKCIVTIFFSLSVVLAEVFISRFPEGYRRLPW